MPSTIRPILFLLSAAAFVLPSVSGCGADEGTSVVQPVEMTPEERAEEIAVPTGPQ